MLIKYIEAVLFSAAKPLTVKKLADICEAKVKDVEQALVELEEILNDRGVMLQQHEQEYELVTVPEVAEFVKKVIKDEEQGELTRASLEALTILAYRGPMTRPELEQIRGVQSAMILRNLMIRGLVEQKDDQRLGQPTYAVTFEFVKHLGLKSIDDLPDYSELRGHTAVADILDQLNPKEDEKDEEVKEDLSV
ncbi:SMC-Scp complex subunit ScpB [Patescibacteria group bacterium]|nr:SMC-Scp complex subunit ScpB [Patescibacteria group bacterium]